MIGTMSVKLAYKKAGIKWEEVDLQGMGIDNESLAKELAVRWDECSHNSIIEQNPAAA